MLTIIQPQKTRDKDLTVVSVIFSKRRGAEHRCSAETSDSVQYRTEQHELYIISRVESEYYNEGTHYLDYGKDS